MSKRLNSRLMRKRARQKVNKNQSEKKRALCQRMMNRLAQKRRSKCQRLGTQKRRKKKLTNSE